MIKTTLRIGGMMCGMCEAHVNDAIRARFNVKKVTSSTRKTPLHRRKSKFPPAPRESARGSQPSRTPSPEGV